MGKALRNDQLVKEIKWPFRSILGAFALSRLLCSLFVYWGHSKHPYLSEVTNGWEGVANWWLNPWTTYDSEWYLSIATKGYDLKTAGFFPLYPWLLQIFANDQVFMSLVGVLISHLAFLIALFIVFRLTELEWNRQVANLTVWILAFSPAAPFWGAVYTESLFLALLAATFLAVRTDRWWLAGFFAALAALCRNPGFLISGALLLEAMSNRQQPSSTGRRIAWTFPLVTFITVQGILWWHFKNPLAGVTAHITRQLDWPWMAIINDINTLATGSYNGAFFIVANTSLLFTFIGIALSLFGWRVLRPGYLLLVGGITLMNLTYAYQFQPHTISSTRYLAPFFPMAQVIAIFLDYKKTSKPIALTFIGINLFIFLFFSFLFGYKSYLG